MNLQILKIEVCEKHGQYKCRDCLVHKLIKAVSLEDVIQIIDEIPTTGMWTGKEWINKKELLRKLKETK